MTAPEEPQAEPVPGLPPQAPPKFDSRAEANAAYNRIMTGAATLQQTLNLFVVRSARAGDPIERAKALDHAIAAGERMLDEFRKARRVVSAVSPLVPMPTPTQPLRPSGFERPSNLGKNGFRPRSF